MNALKEFQRTLSDQSSRAQSFTAHLQFMNEMGPKNHDLRIKQAFSHASALSRESTGMLEEVLGRLEDFGDELESDMLDYEEMLEN